MISGWYLASTSNIPEQYDDHMGIIHTMKQGIYRNRLNRGVPWCLDNGVFTGKFTVTEWLGRLNVLQEYKNTCLFVVIPDVVQDCLGTLSSFKEHRNKVKDLPVAFVSQDGIQKLEDRVPWDEFDCLFVGGSNEHKMGDEGRWFIDKAKEKGKWVHIGRVNSAKRILKFWDADSWDGTTLSFAPSGVVRLSKAVLQTRKMKTGE